MSKRSWGFGEGARERGKEKMERVILWLGLFDYSDRKTLASMLGVNERGQHAFFSKLEKSGFVVTDRAPGISTKIYSLGEAGYELAGMLLPEMELKRRRRLPSWVSLVHSFSIQAAVVHRLDDIEKVQPEKALQALRAVRLPDAILTMRDESRIALEVELNHKSTARIYHIFLSHLRNIRKGHYNRVVYLFPNDALAKVYREKFMEPRWPIYRMNENKRLVFDSSRTYEAHQVQQSGLFSFQTEELYQL